MRRYVLDASVLVSAALSRPQSPPAVLLKALEEGSFEAIGCPLVLRELSRALARPYPASKVTADTAREYVVVYAGLATLLPDPTEAPRVIERDAGDDYLVALAREARADAIVSGDRDLLDQFGLEPPAIDARIACREIGAEPAP